ncbi:MAG: hypothetical protein JXA73_24605 [Acidobacteria bacterium]|nr:hypothetical protein [Acidobacteriota bacterium]
MMLQAKRLKTLILTAASLLAPLYCGQPVKAMPAITNITAPAQTGRYEKFEITFDVNSVAAQNFQLPYDPAPPKGIDPSYEKHRGISVDAEFTPDDWQTTYRQPAFYYYHYLDGGLKPAWDGHSHEWYYPTGKAAWKVRFSPNQVGTWRYRLRATDAGGTGASGIYSFTVTSSDKNGFLRVGKKDPRYFEYDDGTLFLSPGLNAGGDLAEPIKNNEPELIEFKKNHILLLRNWISGLYGSAWLQWIGGRNIYDGYLPRAGILPFHDPLRNHDFMTLYLTYPEGWFDACRMEDWNDYEAVKPNTTYRLSIRYWGRSIEGPRNAGRPNYGLVGKISKSWCPNCYEPDTGTVVTAYGKSTSDWSTIEGTWHSGDHNFLPRVYIGLENVNQGQVNILSISLREVIGDGHYGHEILRQSSMEFELDFPDIALHAMDKYVELAEKYGIYLKLVLMEKNDQIYYKLDDDGTFVINGETDNLDGFYGLGREMNKTRWLQKAWWRYVQARWGYSTNIHSWELTNEGDPFLTKHWEIADELGKYMRCDVFGIASGQGDGALCAYQHPNRHMVTTSFWHSFPGYSTQTGNGLWGSPKYPNIDYADVHAYISTSPAPVADKLLMEKDAAYYHLWHSRQYGGWNLKLPLIRGEAGMVPYNGSTYDKTGLGIQKDLQGIWYHNYVWSSLDSGALYEMYWHANPHIYLEGAYDHRAAALSYHNFMAGIALNNGRYQDLGADVSHSDLRVVGQKDVTSGNAHLWIQNKNHTWKNVVDGSTIAPVSGIVRIGGFVPNKTFKLEWWDTGRTSGQVAAIETRSSSASGNLEIQLSSLKTDIALKITDAAGQRPEPPQNVRIR